MVIGSIPKDAMRQLLFKGILHLCEARPGVTWFFPRSQAAGEVDICSQFWWASNISETY